MAKKIFVSVPMSGRTDEQIRDSLAETMATFLLKNDLGEEVIFVDNFNIGPKAMADMEKEAKEIKIPNLVYLGEAIKKMADCDAVIFAGDYVIARGCTIEEHAARLYGLETYYISKEGVTKR